LEAARARTLGACAACLIELAAWALQTEPRRTVQSQVTPIVRTVIHYCGNANDQVDNFLPAKGLRGINNYALAKVVAVRELKAGIDRRLVLFLADFTPRDYDK